MFYEPTCKPTMKDLIGFLESKPADETYDWKDARRCVCGQFFGTQMWGRDNDDFIRRTGIDINLTAMEVTFKDKTSERFYVGTFGDVLKRVRELT